MKPTPRFVWEWFKSMVSALLQSSFIPTTNQQVDRSILIYFKMEVAIPSGMPIRNPIKPLEWQNWCDAFHRHCHRHPAASDYVWRFVAPASSPQGPSTAASRLPFGFCPWGNLPTHNRSWFLEKGLWKSFNGVFGREDKRINLGIPRLFRLSPNSYFETHFKKIVTFWQDPNLLLL